MAVAVCSFNIPIPYDRHLLCCSKQTLIHVRCTQSSCCSELEAVSINLPHPQTPKSFDEEEPVLQDELSDVAIEAEVLKIASRLRKCKSIKALSEGKRIHEHIVKIGLEKDRFLGNLLIQMYGKCGSVKDAYAVFDKLLEKNCFSWNMMIGTYGQNGQVKEARELFEQMPEKDVVSWNSVISAYIQVGQLQEAIELFEAMPERSVVSWTSMIVAYAKQGQIKEARSLFDNMPHRNVVTWTAMVDAYVQLGELAEARHLFEEMPTRNVVSWTAMISGYSQQGQMDEALRLFLEMPQRNVFSWTAMIGGYAQHGHPEKALDFFQQMKRTGLKPDRVTFISILDACAAKANLVEGKKIHKSIIGKKLEHDIVVQTALIDMYAKCGSLCDAQAVFKKMNHKNLVSWNALITAYAEHGCSKEALESLQIMQSESQIPNQSTLSSILSACNHGGLVEDGCHLALSVSMSHHITPALDHFNSIIDISGRMGWLDYAEELINNMPYHPNVISLTTLISSCRIYSDMKFCRRAANLVFELCPGISSPYVMLSSIYMAAGLWDEAETVNKMMENRGMRGCSYVDEENDYFMEHVDKLEEECVSGIP